MNKSSTSKTYGPFYKGGKDKQQTQDHPLFKDMYFYNGTTLQEKETALR